MALAHTKPMKLIAHTKYGKFEGKESPYDEVRYEEISNFLCNLSKLSYYCFTTANGEIHMTRAMIDDSIIELVK